MTVGLALVLASHTMLRHDMLDMTTHYDSQWDLTTELRVDAAGAATFHIAGNVTSQGVELTSSAGARTVMASHVTRVDDTWSGRATISATSIVVRFDHRTQYTGTIDVEWRCDASRMTVSGVVTPVWTCATSQRMTTRSGPGQTFPEYLQVPTYLAAPAVALKVDELARGGADHRSSVVTMQLSR